MKVTHDKVLNSFKTRKIQISALNIIQKRRKCFQYFCSQYNLGGKKQKKNSTYKPPLPICGPTTYSNLAPASSQDTTEV